MRTLLLAASALAAVSPSARAATPTSYIDVHQITSFTKLGNIERGFLFRVPASESNFAVSPPKGPKWALRSALTGGAGKEPDHLKHANMKDGGTGSHPTHRLMLPPAVDEYLCNEAEGTADYNNPAGNAASGVFDPDTLLSGYEENYVLVPRGRCTFEAKARSAQRLGAAGVVVRNTLDSRYRLVDDDAASSAYNVAGPDWANTRWPVDRRDYECGDHKAAGGVGWRAEIETDMLMFTPAPYVGSSNDALLTGPAADGNLCAKQPVLENFQKHCPSERCLLTGRNVTQNGTKLEACCAWDLYVRMSTDGEDGDAVPQEEEEPITIPALFVTMDRGEELYDVVVDAASQQGGDSVRFVTIVPYGRWYPSVHYSSIVVWALALFTLWIAAYESAKEYRTSWKKISLAVSDGVLIFQRSGAAAGNAAAAGRRERAATEDTVDLAEEHVDFQLAPEVEMANRNAPAAASNNQNASSNQNGADVITHPDDGSFTISDDAEADDFVGNPPSSHGFPNDVTSPTDGSSFAPVSTDEEPQAPAAGAPPAQQRQPQRIDVGPGSAAAQNLEINLFHAVAFVVAASAFLFVLFFFNLDKIIRVLYGLGGSVAVNQVLFYPLYQRIAASRFVPPGVSVVLKANVFGNLPGCRGEYFKWIDVLSAVTGYAMGLAWIVIGLTWVQPMTNAYYWIFQDVMGVCFCVLILGLIHINTIMVASVLLLLVFVYDVFYVLISPLIFGSSVMIDVATGSNGVDPSFCEKYPSDRACRGALAPLPMLVAVPWFNDFRGGFSMLGLGDIILPGLLISFAARYDSAVELVRRCAQTTSTAGGEDAADTEVDAVGHVDDGSGDGSSPKQYHYHLGRVQKALFGGYFAPLVMAYGIGLMVAYLVVWSTRRGQPALLYLVPACLGTMLFLGWQRRELSELWTGPKAMRKANRMVAVAGRIPERRPEATTSETNASLPERSAIV